MTVVSRKKVLGGSIDEIGLDDDCNVAHDTEIEFVLSIKGVFLSFVSYVSQVPVFYNINGQLT